MNQFEPYCGLAFLAFALLVWSGLSVRSSCFFFKERPIEQVGYQIANLCLLAYVNFWTFFVSPVFGRTLVITAGLWSVKESIGIHLSGDAELKRSHCRLLKFLTATLLVTIVIVTFSTLYPATEKGWMA